MYLQHKQAKLYTTKTIEVQNCTKNLLIPLILINQLKLLIKTRNIYKTSQIFTQKICQQAAGHLRDIIKNAHSSIESISIQ